METKEKNNFGVVSVNKNQGNKSEVEVIFACFVMIQVKKKSILAYCATFRSAIETWLLNKFMIMILEIPLSRF